MNSTKKPRQDCICECGAKFLTSAQFGNEEICNACYKDHSRQFLEWLDTLGDDKLHEALLALRVYAAEHGVMVT